MQNSGQFKKGQVPWNKQEKIEKTCKCGNIFHVTKSMLRIKSCSISCGKKGKTPWNKGTKGLMNIWNKGKKWSQEHKQKLRIAHKGLHIGENNGMWKGGSMGESYLQRMVFRKVMQKKVFERDDYTCQFCGERGGDLQVDHIQSWADYVDQRFNMDNCRTVCAGCHYAITFGKPMPKTIKGWGHNLLRGGHLK